MPSNALEQIYHAWSQGMTAFVQGNNDGKVAHRRETDASTGHQQVLPDALFRKDAVWAGRLIGYLGFV